MGFPGMERRMQQHNETLLQTYETMFLKGTYETMESKIEGERGDTGTWHRTGR